MLNSFHNHECRALQGESAFSGRPIYSQRLSEIASMKFGLFRVSYNGCGAIALYNALLMLGKNVSLEDVLRKCRRLLLLGGVFGMFSHDMTRALKLFSVDFVKSGMGHSVKNILSEGKMFIVRMRNGKTVFSREHWFFLLKNPDGTVAAYNLSSKSTPSLFSSTDELCRIISVTCGGKILKAFALV